jgi:chromosome segregation ATPase
MSYLPPDGGLTHLLNVVSDSKAVQERIKQLQSATQEHLDAVQKHQEVQRKASETLNNIAVQQSKLDNEKIQHQGQVAVDKAYIADRKRELENSFAELSRFNDNLKQREQAVNDKAKQLDQMHATLVNREVDISTRTKMVEGREQQVQQHAARNNALIDHLRQNGFLNV